MTFKALRLSSTGGGETLEFQGDRPDSGRSAPAGRAGRGCRPRPGLSPIRRGCGCLANSAAGVGGGCVRRAAPARRAARCPPSCSLALRLVLAHRRGGSSPLASRASSPRGRRSSSARAGACCARSCRWATGGKSSTRGMRGCIESGRSAAGGTKFCAAAARAASLARACSASISAGRVAISDGSGRNGPIRTPGSPAARGCGGGRAAAGCCCRTLLQTLLRGWTASSCSSPSSA